MRSPLPFDLVLVRPLVWILQPSRLVCKFVEEKSSMQQHARKPCSVLGPDPFFEFVPFRFAFHSDVTDL